MGLKEHERSHSLFYSHSSTLDAWIQYKNMGCEAIFTLKLVLNSMHVSKIGLYI